jgi:hypothetical protein
MRDHRTLDLSRARSALTLLIGGGGDGLRETKTGAANGPHDWVADVCARAKARGANGCNADECEPIQLGYPQGAAAGVVATTATGVFPFVMPATLVPYQLILHGNAVGFQVINLVAGVKGPLILGLATSPIGGDAFAANVLEPVPLKADIIDAGVTVTLTLVNPTLGNLTFVGSLKAVLM